MTRYRYCLTLFLCLSLFSIESGVADDAFIKPYKTTYKAKYNFLLPFKGQATRELVKNQENEWQLVHKVSSPMIKLEETSRFDWTGARPKPIDYRYKQRGLTKKRKVSLDFDWPAMTVSNLSSDEPLSFQLLPATLDKLNYQLLLRYDLATTGTSGIYSVADRRRLKEYKFEALGEEWVETPVGKLKALKLRRLRAKDSPRTTDIWLAKDWDYLLVKVRQNENNKSYEILMASGELDGQPIKGE